MHGAFAGYTGITVGLVNTHYVYLPIPVVISAPRRVSVSQSWGLELSESIAGALSRHGLSGCPWVATRLHILLTNKWSHVATFLYK